MRRPSSNLDQNGRPVRPAVPLYLPEEKRVAIAGRIDPTPRELPQPQLLIDHNRTHVIIACKVGAAVIPMPWTAEEADHIADLIRERARIVRGDLCPIECLPIVPPDSDLPPATRPTIASPGTPTESDSTTPARGDA